MMIQLACLRRRFILLSLLLRLLLHLAAVKRTQGFVLVLPNDDGVTQGVSMSHKTGASSRRAFILKESSSSSLSSSPNPTVNAAASPQSSFRDAFSEQWMYEDAVPTELRPLFQAVTDAACLPRQAKTAQGAHDEFRYEWGTWVDDSRLANLMERANELRSTNKDDTLERLLQSNEDETDKRKYTTARRFRVAGGQDWDILLHVFPSSSDYNSSGSSSSNGRVLSWQGRWPTGSWAIVKPLSGLVEISMLRGPNAQGLYRKATTKTLRGGGSSSSSLAESKATAGDDCIKYVGGPLRSYASKGTAAAMLLEVVIRPPIFEQQQQQENESDNGVDTVEELPIRIEDVLAVEIPSQETEENDDRDESSESQSSSQSTTATTTAAEQSKRTTAPLTSKIGMNFDQVGGLDNQLNDIARRVLASRANPVAARRLGISHVKGILLSGPPGCGKTLLARELARLLGAREPQIVNGPEILDKFIGEAEKKVRALFLPAEQEYAQVGDDSALHVIILDEMDAIARKRGSMTADTTGVRDSVVNQLLSKMDGVKQASNVLVVGLTNRPELLDPALLRPGRLEVQLRVELPDLLGRRDILRIHTRQMKESGALSQDALDILEDTTPRGMAARMEHYSGAEIAGVVRSAASFALARSASGEEETDSDGTVTAKDLRDALLEVRPALGKQDDILHMRYPQGISVWSPGMERITRDLLRFTTPVPSAAPRLQSLLLVGSGGRGGAGASALAAWAAAQASAKGHAEYVRLVTALDILTGDGAAGDEARATALVDKFSEARESKSALLVLDDVDQLCAGSGPGGYSSIMLATLRALLRNPPSSSLTAKAGGHSKAQENSGAKSMQVIAATSRSDAACMTLYEIFGETLVVPLLSNKEQVAKLLEDSPLAELIIDKKAIAQMIFDRVGPLGCKTALRLAERAVATGKYNGMISSTEKASLQASCLDEILNDLAGDEGSLNELCAIK